ncbi:hypothetical protein [Mesobacillus jeotgali]|nr:hypothetical protein [Mesobacillus jeotgali]
MSELWTALVLKEEKLSKHQRTLDSFGDKRGKAVQTSANFGQLW